MSRLSRILRDAEDGHGGTLLRFMCPGCERTHAVAIGTGPGQRWAYNGNPEKPTFSPSVLVRTGHYCNPGEKPGNCACDFQQRYPDEEPWPWPCVRCHSFVTDGRIQFLSDCTHSLAGQTVDLPEWDF